MGQAEYLQCPFCGWCRPVRYGVKQKNGGVLREVDFGSVDPGKVKVWQLRELAGAGRASKKARIKIIDYKTLSMLSDQEKQKIKNQCEKILKILAES